MQTRRLAAHVLPHALLDPDLTRRLEAQPLAVFLDYDGTLSPIVAQPAEARLAPAMAAALEALARRHPCAVISGRRLEDLRGRVALPGLHYAGNHGFEIQPAQGEAFALGEEHVEAVSAAQGQLEQALGPLPGVLIEHKRYSLSVHYRLADPLHLPRIRAAADLAARRQGLRLKAGKQVLELRPDLDWHKGKAVRWLLEHVIPAGRLPLFIGDDLTDEDAFRELAEEGIGILVSEEPRPTAAGYGLRDVEEVRRFLERLAVDRRMQGSS